MTRLSHASTRLISISKLASLDVFLILSMATVGGCSSADKNPLIGSWKFTTTNNKFGAAGCSSTFVFREKMATITDPPSNAIPKGSVRSLAVRYVPSPTLVSVMTNGPGHVNYTFVDKNHMYTEDAWGKCNFERTK